MTPDALRAAIASARLRPRMYAQTAEHLASMLYGMVAGAASDAVDIGPAWGDAYSPANVHAPTDAEVCDAAEATVAALWPQGDAPAGDECAAFSAAPLDTPMPPAFVAALARLSPAQPVPLDFYGALAAVRNGRFVPPSEWVRCLACGGTGADVDGAPCEPCRGTGLQPPSSDTDLCPHCGALDLDHACPKSAATAAGEAFAAEHPEAAGRILG